MSSLEQTVEDAPRASTLSRKGQRKLFLLGLVASDIIALVLASIVAYLVRFFVGIDLFEESMPTIDFYLNLTAFLVTLWIVLLQRFQLYNMQFLLGGTEEYARVLNACTLAIM